MPLMPFGGSGGGSINSITGLDPQIIKANVGLRALYNKIAPWTQTGSVGNLQSPRGVNPSLINYVLFGDSTGPRTFYNPTTGSSYEGVFYSLARATYHAGGSTSPFTTSGDYWVTDGATHAYDYTVNWTGLYTHVGSGTGVANFGISSSVDSGTEKFTYAIVENDNATTRNFVLALNPSTSLLVGAPSSTDTTNNVITWGSSHGLTAGQQVYTTTTIGGVTAGTFYYVKLGDQADASSTTKFRLYTDSALTSIVDLTASVTGTFYTGVLVNGVTAIMNVDCKGAALAAKKCGFLYIRFTLVGMTGGSFTLSFGGLTTTALSYSAGVPTAAVVQSALEALDASLVGKVGVTLSTATYTVLINCNGLAFNWQTLTADPTNMTPAASTYITWANCLGSALTGGTKMTAVSIAGDCRFWAPISFDRSQHGVCAYQYNTSSLTLANMNTITQGIANTVLRDISPDLCTYEEYIGQASADGTAASATAQLTTFMSWTDTAIETTPDWIHLSYAPTSEVADAVIVDANASAKSLVESGSRIWIDRWTGCPGWSTTNALGWGGDGIHLSYKYWQFSGSIVAKQLGLSEWVGVSAYKPVHAPSGMIQGALQFTSGQSNPNAFEIGSTQFDAYLKVLTSNRNFLFLNSSGSTIAQIGVTTGGSFLPYDTKFTSTSGAQIMGMGVYTTAVTSADITVSAANANNMVHVATGTLTGNRQWILPLTSGKVIAFHNNTAGAFTLTVIGASGTGYAVTQTKKCMLYCDGTNWYQLTAEL